MPEMEDYTPKSPRMRKVYNLVAGHSPVGNMEWRDALGQGGEKRGYALIDAVLRAVHLIRTDFPHLKEEDLYSAGIDALEQDISGPPKNSRSYFVHHTLVRKMMLSLERNSPQIPIQSLDDALEAGEDVQDKTRQGSVVTMVDAAIFKESVIKTLKFVSYRERETIKLRYGLGDGYMYTLEECGAIFKVSRERIRSIEVGAIQKLQLPPRFEKIEEKVHFYTFAELFADGPSHLSIVLDRYASIADAFKRESEEGKIETNAEDILSVVEQKLGKKRAQVLSKLFKGDPLGFIDYVKKQLEIVPDVRSIRAVITLSPEEKAQFAKDKPQLSSVERVFSKDPHAKKALAELSPAERVKYQQAIYARTVESVLPLFVNDPSGTLRKLERLEQKKDSGLITLVREELEGVRNVIIPNLKTPLRIYQKADVLFMNQNPHTLYANPMGLGKSLGLLASFAYRREERMLILAPTSAAVGVWPQEIAKHFAEPPRTVMLRGKMTPSDVEEACKGSGIFIVTHHVLQRCLETLVKQQFDVIAVDESHMLTNPDSARYKSLSQLHAKRKILSSGTPFKNTRAELWAPLRWLAPERFEMTQETFNRTYMQPEGVYLLAYDLRSVMIRRSKAKMLPDLPKMNERVQMVDFKKNEREEYTKMEQTFLAWWKEETRGAVAGTQTIRGMVLNKMHALRQHAIQPKLRVIKDLVAEAKARGEKTVIATTYRDAAEQIRDLFPRTQVCYIDGSVKGASRARAVEDFESTASKKVMVITEAGSQSLNLAVANNMIEVNDPWTWADRQQRVDRVHRLGQEREVNVVTLMTDRSIDEHIRGLILDKKDEFDEVFDAPEKFLAYRSREVRDLHAMLVKMAK